MGGRRGGPPRPEPTPEPLPDPGPGPGGPKDPPAPGLVAPGGLVAGPGLGGRALQAEWRSDRKDNVADTDFIGVPKLKTLQAMAIDTQDGDIRLRVGPDAFGLQLPAVVQLDGDRFERSFVDDVTVRHNKITTALRTRQYYARTRFLFLRPAGNSSYRPSNPGAVR